MADFIIAMLFILLLLGGWIFVQYLSRTYAARHPEFGPAKEEGGGCGQSCLCNGGNCQKSQETQVPSNNNINYKQSGG